MESGKCAGPVVRQKKQNRGRAPRQCEVYVLLPAGARAAKPRQWQRKRPATRENRYGGAASFKRTHRQAKKTEASPLSRYTATRETPAFSLANLQGGQDERIQPPPPFAYLPAQRRQMEKPGVFSYLSCMEFSITPTFGLWKEKPTCRWAPDRRSGLARGPVAGHVYCEFGKFLRGAKSGAAQKATTCPRHCRSGASFCIF